MSYAVPTPGGFYHPDENQRTPYTKMTGGGGDEDDDDQDEQQHKNLEMKPLTPCDNHVLDPSRRLIHSARVNCDANNQNGDTSPVKAGETGHASPNHAGTGTGTSYLSFFRSPTMPMAVAPASRFNSSHQNKKNGANLQSLSSSDAVKSASIAKIHPKILGQTSSAPQGALIHDRLLPNDSRGIHGDRLSPRRPAAVAGHPDDNENHDPQPQPLGRTSSQRSLHQASPLLPSSSPSSSAAAEHVQHQQAPNFHAPLLPGVVSKTKQSNLLAPVGARPSNHVSFQDLPHSEEQEPRALLLFAKTPPSIRLADVRSPVPSSAGFDSHLRGPQTESTPLSAASSSESVSTVMFDPPQYPPDLTEYRRRDEGTAGVRYHRHAQQHQDDDIDLESHLSSVSKGSHLFGEGLVRWSAGGSEIHSVADLQPERRHLSVSTQTATSLSRNTSSYGSNSCVAHVQFAVPLACPSGVSPHSSAEASSASTVIAMSQSLKWWHQCMRRASCHMRVFITSCSSHFAFISSSKIGRSGATLLPLSPRSRNLSDLRYLTRQHAQKMAQLLGHQSPLHCNGRRDHETHEGGAVVTTSRPTLNGLGSVTIHHKDAFDFCLVFKRQEVYSFWADLLDFRIELLGEHLVCAMEWEKTDFHEHIVASDGLDATSSSEPSSPESSYSDSICGSPESLDAVMEEASTPPSTGIHRRRPWTADSQSELPEQTPTPIVPIVDVSKHPSASTPLMDSNGRQAPIAKSIPMSRAAFFSPAGLYSVSETSRISARNQPGGPPKMSLFERALLSPASATSSSTCMDRPVFNGTKNGPPPQHQLIYFKSHQASSSRTLISAVTMMDEPSEGAKISTTTRIRPTTTSSKARVRGPHHANHRVRWVRPGTAMTPSPSQPLAPSMVLSASSGTPNLTGSRRTITTATSASMQGPRLPPPFEERPSDRDLAMQPNHNDLGEDRPNEIRIEDIPNPVVPRGIAVRTQALAPFLASLKRGIVVRKHKPGHEATLCKIISHDGGDTIAYQHLTDSKQAMQLLADQRIRYNRARGGRLGDNVLSQDPISIPYLPDGILAQPWSFVDPNNPSNNDDTQEEVDKKKVTSKKIAGSSELIKEMPAQQEQQGLTHKVTTLASKVVGSGIARTADIVAVHPARNADPRSDSGETATSSFRRSKSDFLPALSFSLVLRAAQRLPRGTGLANSKNIDEYENKWLKGEGSEASFRYLDFEAATEGEYWLIFRGLLLLHRDAAVGRFHAQRSAGIGSHYNNKRLDLIYGDETANSDEHYRLHQDEFHEPVTVGWLEKLVVRFRDLDTTYMEGFTLPGAIPPPSDYFLGFRSPGTAIWSRLRQAGLETQRVYSLDPRQVMIKIRCPSDRLIDVAEVLRLHVKTKKGKFVPFREDMMDSFEGGNDPLDAPSPLFGGFQSALRQTIIDLIVSSRIRESGAQLGQSTELGKLIDARVPLHMPDKLNAIFDAWFFFWRKDNWIGRDGRSLSHTRTEGTNRDDDGPSEMASTPTSSASAGSSCDFEDVDAIAAANADDAKKMADHDEPPSCWTRIFVGCFYQPLDSIEQYFGEKVAFYFAWLQHTAAHLVFLSIAGLVLFICQVSSNNWDHPLRPYFSVVVMLWTFILLINWKKRANFLAYRWGTMNYKEQETTRPQFRGDYKRDEITGEVVVFYPSWKRGLKYLISLPITLIFTAGTLLMILWVHSNRDLQLAQYMVQKTDPQAGKFELEFTFESIGKRAPIVDVELTTRHLLDPTFWLITIGMPAMLGLFLPLLNFILMKLSIMLTEFENYPTESEYRTSLIIKVFSFRFVCYFATMYYYAFISIGSDEAIANGILRVGTGVLVYITVAQWWQYFLGVGFPFLIKQLRMNHRRQRLLETLRSIELEEEDILRALASNDIGEEETKARRVRLINRRLLLEQAQDSTWLEVMNPPHDSFAEYIQAVVQFTFIACFSVVMPLTPLICLFNYLLCMRLDAFKVCRGRRRPIAEKTGGLGVWEHVLHIVVVISVLTNCWLMGFTNTQFIAIGRAIGEVGLFAIVVVWEHVMLLIKYILQTSISPLPKDVRDSIKREQWELYKQRNTSMQARRLQHQKEDEIPASLQADLSFGPLRKKESLESNSSKVNRLYEV